jgi:hypothetical protein
MEKSNSDIYISYRNVDKEFAEKLYAIFKAAGFEVWYAGYHAKPGTIYLDESEEAISQSKFLIALVGEEGPSRHLEDEQKIYDSTRWQHDKTRSILVLCPGGDQTIIERLSVDNFFVDLRAWKKETLDGLISFLLKKAENTSTRPDNHLSEQDLNQIIEKANQLSIETNSSDVALYNMSIDGFLQIWCTDKEKPEGWENVEKTKGRYSKNCAKVAVVHWDTGKKYYNQIYLTTDAPELAKRDKKKGEEGLEQERLYKSIRRIQLGEKST